MKYEKFTVDEELPEGYRLVATYYRFLQPYTLWKNDKVVYFSNSVEKAVMFAHEDCVRPEMDDSEN